VKSEKLKTKSWVMAFGQPKSGTDTLKLAAWSLQLSSEK